MLLQRREHALQTMVEEVRLIVAVAKHKVELLIATTLGLHIERMNMADHCGMIIDHHPQEDQLHHSKTTFATMTTPTIGQAETLMMAVPDTAVGQDPLPMARETNIDREVPAPEPTNSTKTQNCKCLDEHRTMFLTFKSS